MINISLSRDNDNNKTIKICSGESCEPKKKEVLDADEARKAALEAAAITAALPKPPTFIGDNNYYSKYMKYKNKYLRLKSKI